MFWTFCCIYLSWTLSNLSMWSTLSSISLCTKLSGLFYSILNLFPCSALPLCSLSLSSTWSSLFMYSTLSSLFCPSTFEPCPNSFLHISLLNYFYSISILNFCAQIFLAHVLCLLFHCLTWHILFGHVQWLHSFEHQPVASYQRLHYIWAVSKNDPYHDIKFGPRRDKTCLRALWHSETQTSLLSYRD